MDALSSYISFLSFDGTPLGFNFQNFFQDETRVYEGRNYAWAGFGYSGGVFDLQGANVEANLVFYTSDLILGFAEESQSQRWLVNVKTVWLNSETLEETSDKLNEIYAITAYQNNLERTVFRLSSPLDARTAELPARVLARRIVGNIPASGAIPFI